MTNSPRAIYLDLEVINGGKPRAQGSGPLVLRLIPPIEARPIEVPPRASGIAAPLATQQLADASSSNHDVEIFAALDLPAAIGESSEALHRRREHALGTLFSTFTSSDAVALHNRLSNAMESDPVSARFGRMVPDRRARLMAFLADARRQPSSAIQHARGSSQLHRETECIMSDYDNKPDSAKQASVALPARPLPPAPKPARAPMPAKRVPAAEDLLAPTGSGETKGHGSATLVKMSDNYVNLIYGQLGRSLEAALAGLKDPPPPRDRSLALRMLATLAETLSNVVLARLGYGVLHALKDRAFAEPALNVVKDQLKPLTALAADGARALVIGTPAPGMAAPHDAEGVADPSATTLLGEFGSRAKNKLGFDHVVANNQLLAVMERVQEIQPSELESLVETLDAYAQSTALGAWFQAQIAMGWLNFSASLSIGQRETGQSIMPGANTVGGSRSAEWRRGHAGFVEIDVDFPDEVNGMEGVVLGKIRVAHDGPGAARILRASADTAKPAPSGAPPAAAANGAADFASAFATSYEEQPRSYGLPLATLPVYRRLWLGRNGLDRMPDVVITPDHKLEVNGNSSLLAAVATGTGGRFLAVQGRGREEETEQAGLVEKALRPKPRNPDEEGHLGAFLGDQIVNSTTYRENIRLGELVSNSLNRARQAEDGATKIVQQLLGTATTEQLEP